jgi:hypothetical protein
MKTLIPNFYDKSDNGKLPAKQALHWSYNGRNRRGIHQLFLAWQSS